MCIRLSVALCLLAIVPAQYALAEHGQKQKIDPQAAPEVFWLSPDEEIRLIPQPAPDSVVDQAYVEPVEAFTEYPDRRPPEVPPRKNDLEFYPCSRCHNLLYTNETPRALLPVHEVALEHGEGRMWCLTCHHPRRRDDLHDFRGRLVDIDDAWMVCGQCHSNRQKDWYYGAHGKRVYHWQGDAIRYNCTHCHNPHRPAFMQRKPQPVPPVRAGLEPMKAAHQHTRQKVWERETSDKARGAGQESQENGHE
jgi:hypothetical protein